MFSNIRREERRVVCELVEQYLASGGRITVCPPAEAKGRFNASVSNQKMTGERFSPAPVQVG